MLPLYRNDTGDTKNACVLYRDGVPYRTSSFVVERQRRGPLYFTERDSTGWRPPRPYKRCIIHSECLGGSVSGETSGKRYTFTGIPANFDLWNNYNFNRILDSSYYALWNLNDLFMVNTKVLLKIKDQKVNYGEALAEARSTISQLGSTGRTLLRSYLYARKGKWSKVLKELRINKRHKFKAGKEASGRWLELQYGWLPLMGDLQGTMELIQEGFRQKNYRFSAKSKFTMSLTGEDVMSPIVANPYNHIVGSGTRLTKTKVYAQVKSRELHALTQIGLTDPFQVAWALVPFSFVIDWFLPIGSFLEGLGATKGLDFVSGTSTLSVKFQGEARTQLNPSTVKNQTGEFVTTVAIEATERKVLTDFPSAALYYKSPFSTLHGINALALFRQLTR